MLIFYNHSWIRKNTRVMRSPRQQQRETPAPYPQKNHLLRATPTMSHRICHNNETRPTQPSYYTCCLLWTNNWLKRSACQQSTVNSIRLQEKAPETTQPKSISSHKPRNYHRNCKLKCLQNHSLILLKFWKLSYFEQLPSYRTQGEEPTSWSLMFQKKIISDQVIQ